MKLKISANQRFLQYEDGTPFFYLGDTCWELFHRLTREEIEYVLAVRAEQGFNVIQAVALAEFDGLDKPNAYGQRPLKRNAEGVYDPLLPDIDGGYWDLVDFTIERAARHGMYIGLLPTWGDKWNQKWGVGPVIFNAENAFAYGRWIGSRYAGNDNIIWILGGDRPIENDGHLRTVRAMAEGIRAATGDRHLMTFHPTGSHGSAEHVGGETWPDFHMWQTGHSVDTYKCYERIKKTYDLSPAMPVLDGEPRYEDHPADFDASLGYLWSADDVRQSAYWDVLSGAFGHVYGNHCIWSFNREPEDYFPYRWQDALRHDGAAQMTHLKKLLLARPFFERRPAQELLANTGDATSHIAAARGEKYAMMYSPLGLPLSVHMHRLGGKVVKAQWYCPRTGAWTVLGIYPGEGACTFVPPAQGKGNDIVLVLDVMK